jgi:prepilin-type N-terminal cleavage/methylation domain-containing protein
MKPNRYPKPFKGYLPARSQSASTQHAFTLIELLIVIAIIAILAGILFPVFASAKIAAKRTASLSNLKQIVLGELMYSIDFDDNLTLFANGDASKVEDSTSVVDTWVWSTQPYVKSLSVLVDPVMGDRQGIFLPSGPQSTRQNQNQYPDYGVNYVFLSPWERDPSTGSCSKSGSVTTSGAAHPASTIFFITTYEPNKDASGDPTGGYSDFGSWIVTAPAMQSILQNSPNYCIAPWIDWSKNPIGSNYDGPFTGEASQRYNGGAVTALLDGHAKYMRSDAQAAGTNWDTSPYGQARITHASQYMWDYDGTFFGTTPPE